MTVLLPLKLYLTARLLQRPHLQVLDSLSNLVQFSRKQLKPRLLPQVHQPLKLPLTLRPPQQPPLILRPPQQPQLTLRLLQQPLPQQPLSPPQLQVPLRQSRSLPIAKTQQLRKFATSSSTTSSQF